VLRRQRDGGGGQASGCWVAKPAVAWEQECSYRVSSQATVSATSIPRHRGVAVGSAELDDSDSRLGSVGRRGHPSGPGRRPGTCGSEARLIPAAGQPEVSTTRWHWGPALEFNAACQKRELAHSGRCQLRGLRADNGCSRSGGSGGDRRHHSGTRSRLHGCLSLGRPPLAARLGRRVSIWQRAHPPAARSPGPGYFPGLTRRPGVQGPIHQRQSLGKQTQNPLLLIDGLIGDGRAQGRRAARARAFGRRKFESNNAWPRPPIK